MTARSVVHASFTITRRWKAAPARVFAAFADEKQKDKWFAGPGLGRDRAQLRFPRRRP